MARRRFRFRGRRLRRRGFRRVFRSFRKKVGHALWRFAETKNAVTGFAFTITNGAPIQSVVFPSIPQGSGDNNRIGNRIFAKNFQLKMVLYVSTAAANANYGAFVRIYVVWPRKNSATDALALINIANFPPTQLMDQDNWIVWKDTYAMPFSETLNGYFAIPWKKKITFNKRFPTTMEFSGSAQLRPNKYPFVVISSTLGTDLNHVIQCQGYWKITYKDI